MIKKTPSNTQSNNIWKTILAIQEGKSVNLENFTAKEQFEIQESLEIIEAIQTSQENIEIPTKTAFNEMLINLPQIEASSSPKSWRNFFSIFHRNIKQWVAIPVLGLLAFFAINIHQKPAMQVVVAQNLSEEIQNDFNKISQDIEEIELLKEELNLVYLKKEESLTI
jgi:hypothetical protein